MHSTQGRCGPGIYFADLDIASKVSKYRGSGTGCAVIECRVNPKYCKESEHPRWDGVT